MSNVLYLLVSSADGQKVLVDKEIIIGRDKACTIVLGQGHASRQHAKLSPGSGGITIEDLNSTNGTVVNGAKISKPTLLKPGGELVIGKEKFSISPADQTKPLDTDATMLFTGEATVAEKSGSQSDEAFEDTIPEAPVVENINAVAQGASVNSPSNSKAPPSWVLNNQQAVDGTKFIDKKVMQDVLLQSSGAIQDKVTIPTLIGSSEPITGMRFQLAGDGVVQWEVGRSANCQVMINHDSVSSNHAQIINENGRWKLVDVMSANGTYVNAKKGLSSYLSSGDVLRFGQVECTFILPERMAKRSAKKIVAKETKKERSMFKTALIAFVITGVVAAAVIFGLDLLKF